MRKSAFYADIINASRSNGLSVSEISLLGYVYIKIY